MRHFLPALLLTFAATAASAQSPATPGDALPIVNASPEQKQLIEKTPDGGLPPAVGVQNVQVFRATRVPDAWQDSHGWTYNHHQDLAIFKGHYLLAFTNGRVDEDIPPDNRLFMTSPDGLSWTQPQLLFPDGTSGSTRMYFYLAKNGRMVAMATLRMKNMWVRNAHRTQGEPPPEPPAARPAFRGKRGILAREIKPDLSLGDPYILQRPDDGEPVSTAPALDACPDTGLQSAFKDLLGNHLFLEQEDYGSFLGADRMSAYEGQNDSFGKAFCFYRRKDGALVGVAKNGYVVVSRDDGLTWSTPVIPKGHITNNAKVWVQPTADGLFAMILNPTPRDRFPMVIATSDDGITFRNMRVVHGEVPQERYPGMFKNPGPQYFRGVSLFDNDGSLPNKDFLIAYSSNKEDIWVSRIPIPMQKEETATISDHFDTAPREGFLVPNWNIYSPKWAPVSIVNGPVAAAATTPHKALQLDDRDPYDYARAARVFKNAKQLTLRLTLTVAALNATAENPFELDVTPAFGTSRPVRLAITADKKLQARAGARWLDIAAITLNEPLHLELTVDCTANNSPTPTDDTYLPNGDTKIGRYSLTVNGAKKADLPFAEPASALARLTLRTGPYRCLGTPVSNGQPTYPTPIDPATDHPVPPNIFLIQDVEIH